jgi:hypothetical protein
MAAVKKKKKKTPSRTTRRATATTATARKAINTARAGVAITRKAKRRDPAYEKVDQRMINYIPVCLEAALNDPRLARECVQRFEGLPDDPDKIGAAMAKLFVERWGLSRAQVKAIRDWPGHQLLAIKHTVIDAGRSRMAGKPVVARVFGRIGVPQSTSISWIAPNYLDIEMVGPDAP